MSVQPGMPVGLRFYSDFGREIHDELPVIAQSPVVEQTPGMELQYDVSPGTPLSAVFQSSHSGVSLTLQPHLIVARWSRSIDSDGPYPGFSVLMSLLKRAGKILDGLLEVKQDVFVVNISYLNLIEMEMANADQVTQCFSDTIVPTILRDKEVMREVNIAWKDTKGIDVRWRIHQGAAATASGQLSGYAVHTTAGIIVENRDPFDCMVMVHNHLVDTFVEALSSKGKEVFGYDDGS